MKRLPRVSLLPSAAALLIHFIHPLRIGLIYDRAAVQGLELWRLVTCHWVHLNTSHLFWSGLTFLGLGSACEIMAPKKFYIILGVSSLMIPALIFITLPGLNIYAGLSGIDCALYGFLFASLLKQELINKNKRWVAIYAFFVVMLIAKAFFEALSGTTVFVSHAHTELTPVPLAHLAGGIIGSFMAVYVGSRSPGRIMKRRSR